MKKIKDLTISVVTHEYFKGSGQELRDYLINKKINRLYYAAHMFPYAKESRSYRDVYVKGEQKLHHESPLFPIKNEFLYYFRDAFYNLYYFLFVPNKIDVFVGVDSFNALFGLILRKLGKVDKVVFFTIDYVMHDRFPWAWLNKFYVKMDRWAFFGADYTWNVSDRMSRQRVKEIGPKAEGKVQLVAPIGIMSEARDLKVKRKDNVLVYSGHLTKESGVEMLVHATPKLVEKFPDVEIRIIGDGPVREDLEKFVKENNIEKNVNFAGFINTGEERERWLRLLKESTIGMAPFEVDETSYKQFSDVTKPKDYMSCGLPIIVTTIIPLSEDVKEQNLGRVVDYTIDSLVESVTELLENKKERRQIEQNVANFCKDMTWENIYNRVFEQMGIETK